GIFLLSGPTGSGKTKLVEVVAECLHHADKHVLRFDCGEFHSDHLASKLIGAPPGYLGHRETSPMLTQAKLSAIASDRCDLSVLLFDEFEKAGNAFERILLGVFDKGTLSLGDNSNVNLSRCLIFMTTNLGAKKIRDIAVGSGIGFGGKFADSADVRESKMGLTGERAAKKNFSPEFYNRLDAIIAFRPLTEEDMNRIIDFELAAVQQIIYARLGSGAVVLSISDEA